MPQSPPDLTPETYKPIGGIGDPNAAAKDAKGDSTWLDWLRCPPWLNGDEKLELPPYLEAKDDIHLGEGYKVPRDVFHPGGGRGLKDRILRDATASGTKWKGKLGRNPNVKIKDGKIILEGTGDFKNRKPIETNLDPADYPEISR